VISLSHGEFEGPAGTPFERDVVRHRGAVAIVAVDGDRTVTLVRQYRAALDRQVLELPAGTCDREGEPLEVTASRELVEEVGLQPGSLRRLAAIFNSPGFSDQQTTLFLATGSTSCPTARSGIEEQWMTIEHLPLDGVEERVARGELADSTTIVGLLLARHVLGLEAAAQPAP